MPSLVKSPALKPDSPNRKLVGGLFLITGILSAFFYFKGDHKVEWAAAKFSYTVEDKKVNSDRDTSRATNQLISQLQTALDQTDGTYAIYVYRLAEDKGYGINEQQLMPAASIMKVPIMAATFKAVEEGKITLEDTYNLQAADKRSGSGPIEYMNVGTSLSVQRLLEEMGKKSDNTAPIILIKLLGKDYIGKVMTDLGMTNTNFDDNEITALDINNAWKKLYKDHYLSDEHLQLMWEFLQDSIYEDRIPLGLPQDTQLVHKVGTDMDIWADSGIVLTDKPFVITILNKEVKQDQAKKLVPQITKLIWDYESTRVSK
jgi:beta-lactamase class A